MRPPNARSNQKHVQDCASICMGRPPKGQTSQLKPFINKLKQSKLTFHFFRMFALQFFQLWLSMIHPNFSSLCNILEECVLCIFFNEFSSSTFLTCTSFFCVQWPHNNNLVVTTISLDIFLSGEIPVVHHFPYCLYYMLTSNDHVIKWLDRSLLYLNLH